MTRRTTYADVFLCASLGEEKYDQWKRKEKEMADEFFGLPTHINGMQAPYEIRNPMNSQFSIARHYGGCKAFGTSYVWVPHGGEHDEPVLVRSDLHKARTKAARKKASEAKSRLKKSQGDLV